MANTLRERNCAISDNLISHEKRVIECRSSGARNAYEPFVMSDTRSLFNGFYLALRAFNSVSLPLPPFRSLSLFLSDRPTFRAFLLEYSGEMFINTTPVHLCFSAAIGTVTHGPPKLRHKCARESLRGDDECRRALRIFAIPV